MCDWPFSMNYELCHLVFPDIAYEEDLEAQLLLRARVQDEDGNTMCINSAV